MSPSVLEQIQINLFLSDMDLKCLDLEEEEEEEEEEEDTPPPKKKKYSG